MRFGAKAIARSEARGAGLLVVGRRTEAVFGSGSTGMDLDAGRLPRMRSCICSGGDAFWF